VPVLAALLLGGHAAEATSVRALTLGQLVDRAHRIVHGRCVAVEEVREARGGLPVTEVTVAVAETLKGPAERRLVVRQLGGRDAPAVGPRYVVGEELVLFLHRPGRSGLTSPVGLWQGKLSVVRAAAGAARAPRALAAGGSQAAARGVDLDGLLATVRALVAGGSR
jgi:hypothetical protein